MLTSQERHRRWWLKNRERHNKYQKQWRKDNPEKARTFLRRAKLKRFGLTLESYNDLLEKQEGVCAICKRKTDIALAVDHDHVTGKVRGLLCGSCNLGLGKFQENLVFLQAAITYLSGGED